MVLLIWLYDHMSPFGFYGRRMHAALRCSCKSCEAFRCNKEASGEGSDGEEECLFESRLADPSENNEGKVTSRGTELETAVAWTRKRKGP